MTTKLPYEDDQRTVDDLVDNFWTEYFDSYAIPPYMRQGLKDYLQLHKPPGGFLQAVIMNDLREAIFRADETNIKLLPNYVRFFYNEAPKNCWGSEEKYVKWIEQRRPK